MPLRRQKSLTQVGRETVDAYAEAFDYVRDIMIDARFV